MYLLFFNNYFLPFLNRGIFKIFLRLEFQIRFFKKYSATIIVSSKNLFISNFDVSNFYLRNIFSIIKISGVL